MSGVSALPWSVEQQTMLEAMGFAFYRPVTPSSREAAPALPPGEVANKSNRVDAQPRERLWSALRLAAGGGDVSALVADIEALRRDPRLKRALWPRLRALRGASSGHPGSHDRRP